jgi:hypothetical protein
VRCLYFSVTDQGNLCTSLFYKTKPPSNGLVAVVGGLFWLPLGNAKVARDLNDPHPASLEHASDFSNVHGCFHPENVEENDEEVVVSILADKVSEVSAYSTFVSSHERHEHPKGEQVQPRKSKQNPADDRDVRVDLNGQSHLCTRKDVIDSLVPACHTQAVLEVQVCDKQ